jgi:hypothetical protein
MAQFAPSTFSVTTRCFPRSSAIDTRASVHRPAGGVIPRDEAFAEIE